MRQFKFIRGKYTDENIFNSDETTACLFAYDKNGELVEFTVKNDKDFQDKFAELSSARLSEIYTLRPSQFEISAKQEEAGHYSFDFKANENVLDGSVPFPSDVVKSAQLKRKAKTTAKLKTTNKIPVLNLDGDDDGEKKTLTTFTFNNKKTFTRNLVFKVSGLLKERGYATAQGENIDAYPTADGKIDFGGTTGSNIKNGTYYQGILQTETTPKSGTIIKSTQSVSTSGKVLNLAKNYTAADGFTFIKDGKFASDISYKDNISFDLYKALNEYLVKVDADAAVDENKTFVEAGDKYKLNNNIYEVDTTPNAYGDAPYYLISQVESYNSADTLVKKISSVVVNGTRVETYAPLSGDEYLVNSKDANTNTGLPIYGNLTQLLSVNEGTTFLSKMIDVDSDKLAFVKYTGDANYTKLGENAKISVKHYLSVSGGDAKELKSISRVDTTTQSGTSSTYTVTYSDGSTQDTIDASREGIYTITYKLFDEANNEFTLYKDFITTNPLCWITDNYVNYAGPTAPNEYTDGSLLFKAVPATINTTYNLKDNTFIAYEKDTVLPQLLHSDGKTVVYKSEGENILNITSKDYDFYKVYTNTAYERKGTCTLRSSRANNQFVEGYAASYKNYYVFKNKQLSNISADDIANKNTIAYYESNDHHIVGNGVYDDSTDTTRYVALSEDEWVEGVEINTDNTLVKDGNVIAPNTTENVLRFITKVEVNATQTD